MTYQIGSHYLQTYSPKEIHELKRVFKQFDLDENGSIDARELSVVLQQVGEEDHSPSRVAELIAEVDTDQSGTIEFGEFLTLLTELREGDFSAPPPPVSTAIPPPDGRGQESEKIVSIPPQVSTPSPPPPPPPPAETNQRLQQPRGSDGGLLADRISKFGGSSSSGDANRSGRSGSVGRVVGKLNQNSNPYLNNTPAATSASPLTSSRVAAPLPTNEDSNDVASAFTETRSSSVSSSSGISGLASVVQKHITIHEVKSSGGGVHSYSEDEKVAFSEHINNCLNGDPQLSMLPLDPNSDDLFTCVSDGVLLCKLINQAVEDTIDIRAVNIKFGGGTGKTGSTSKNTLNIYEKTENQNLCINAAKSIGCSVVNIGPSDLMSGKRILILGLVWQILKIQLTATINLKSHPELVCLLMEGETLEDFMKLPKDIILLRWMNYHLAAAKHDKKVSNFGKDVMDATAYNVLLAQIAPSLCVRSRCTDVRARAEHVIVQAKKIDVQTFLKPTDIMSGNPKLNMSFVAQLFNTCPALTLKEEEKQLVEAMDDEDIGDTREERCFRMWINSLGIEDVYVNHLYSDVRDGVMLLNVLDKISPGCVSWSKVNRQPKNKFKKVENANYCVVLGKQLKFSLVNVGGVDLTEGNKKLVLAVIWQAMRYHQLAISSSLRRGQPITDKDVIDWANQKVKSQGKDKSRSMIQFRDLTLSDSYFLLDLVYAIEPRAVNWEQVLPGRTNEDKESNAKYLLSVARKIGATIFLTFEDVVEVKPKMIMTFVTTLMALDAAK